MKKAQNAVTTARPVYEMLGMYTVSLAPGATLKAPKLGMRICQPTAVYCYHEDIEESVPMETDCLDFTIPAANQ